MPTDGGGITLAELWILGFGLLALFGSAAGKVCGG